MKFTRRQTFVLSAGAAAFFLAGSKADLANAKMENVEKELTEKFGKMPKMGKVKLTAPEIAENGNTVPVGVSVESAMDGSDQVKSVTIFAIGNPTPDVATFNFSEMSGKANASTRMRLAKTQDVVAVAVMADGSVYMDKAQVKVTIGGCGG